MLGFIFFFLVHWFIRLRFCWDLIFSFSIKPLCIGMSDGTWDCKSYVVICVHGRLTISNACLTISHD